MNNTEMDIAMINHWRRAGLPLPTLDRSRRWCFVGVCAMTIGELSGWGMATGAGLVILVYASMILAQYRRVERVRSDMAWQEGRWL